jgi:hypothetical protein
MEFQILIAGLNLCYDQRAVIGGDVFKNDCETILDGRWIGRILTRLGVRINDLERAKTAFRKAWGVFIQPSRPTTSSIVIIGTPSVLRLDRRKGGGLALGDAYPWTCFEIAREKNAKKNQLRTLRATLERAS